MSLYKVFFTNGSTDIIDADTAADAREAAAKEFGRVKRVEILDEEPDEDEEDSAENEEEDDEDEEDDDDDE